MKVEWFTFINALRFSLRHTRYLIIFLYVYFNSLLHWRRTRLVRYGYVYLQIIDDIIDGDRDIGEQPGAYVMELLHQLKARKFGDRPIDQLAKEFYLELNKRVTADENPVIFAEKIIENMLFDYPRRLEGKWLAEDFLKRHMFETFELSMNLMLIAMGSPIRMSQLPSLVRGLAWCSMRRDLKDDIKLGIINIPKEILLTAGFNPDAPLDYESSIRNPVVESYLESELVGVQKDMLQFEVEKKSVQHQMGFAFINVFAKSIYKYVRRDLKKTPTLASEGSYVKI